MVTTVENRRETSNLIGSNKVEGTALQVPTKGRSKVSRES